MNYSHHYVQEWDKADMEHAVSYITVQVHVPLPEHCMEPGLYTSSWIYLATNKERVWIQKQIYQFLSIWDICD